MELPSSVRSRFFGVVDYAREDVITFPAGIPPFVGSTRFIFLSDEKKRPLLFLQSVDDEALCFITIPVRVVDPDYQLAVEADDLRLLGRKDTRQTIDDFSCVAILTIREGGPVTANLLAPVLVDTAKRLGVQAIRTDRLYQYAHPLDQPIRAGEPAC